MTRLLMISLAVLFYAAPALAQAPCVKRDDFINRLSANYAEAPIAMGLTASGRVLEVLKSDSGSWTIIVTAPNGVSCGMASGENWEAVKKPPKGPPA